MGVPGLGGGHSTSHDERQRATGPGPAPGNAIPADGPIDPHSPNLQPTVPLPPAASEGDHGSRTTSGRIEPDRSLLLPTDLRDHLHPGHTAFQRTLGEVYRMEDGKGIPHGPYSEKIAAALLVEAERNKQGITSVELSSDGKVHGIARYSAFEPEKRVNVNPREVLE